MSYLSLPQQLHQQFVEIIQNNTLAELEQNPFDYCDKFEQNLWQDFSERLYQQWREHHWCVIGNIPNESADGLVLAALALNHQYKTYRQGKIVKHFKMSPWTKDLSHTLTAGYFHTDINTTEDPPEITLIQCHKPDPTQGAGELRVAVLTDLIAYLEQQGLTDTLAFLADENVRMLDDLKADCWQGRIVQDGTIRFHPETLRAAAKRYGLDREYLEKQLEILHQACMRVAHVINLAPGEALVVSNHKALHYRGECTASFEQFPTKFNAREIFVLHLLSQKLSPKVA